MTTRMTTRVRLIIMLTRPAVVMLLGLYLALGYADTGHVRITAHLALAFVAVAGFLLFSVACNDLADEHIDAINLPGKRPLTAGLLGRGEFTVIGVAAGLTALATSFPLGRQAVTTTAAGLALSAAYSLRPVRLADRGLLASLVLPACYVLVPFLLGAAAATGPTPTTPSWLLLAGLYTGFIGRILLKDFRDVRGDALFGKRTFLIRHGKATTCLLSALLWATGTALILLAAPRSPDLILTQTTCVAIVLLLLHRLARARTPRAEETIISTIAIVGRGMLILLITDLGLQTVRWPGPLDHLVMPVLLLLTLGPAATMLRHGPLTRLTAPAETAAASSSTVSIRPTYAASTEASRSTHR